MAKKKLKKKVKVDERVYLMPDDSPAEDRVVKVISTGIVDAGDPPKWINRIEIEKTKNNKLLVKRQYYYKDGSYYFGKALGFNSEDLTTVVEMLDTLNGQNPLE